METTTGSVNWDGVKPCASPDETDARVSVAPPNIIWMPAETGFDDGRARCRDQMVPTAQATVPARSANNAVNWIRSLETWLGVRLRVITPPRPQMVPMSNRMGAVEPERLHSKPAIQTGMSAETIAATPEGTSCSAQNNGP